MSGQNQTAQMVVTYPNSTAKAALDSNFQNHVPKPRPQTYNGKFERNFNNDDNNCRNVKNSWLLRIVAVFSLAVTIVIFATLHSKLRSSFYDLSVEVRKLQLYIDTHSENMEKRIIISLNKTHFNGKRPCPYFHIIPEKDGKTRINGTKLPFTPKQEASGRDNQKDSSRNSKKAGQRKKQATNKRKMSRRSTVYTRWGTTQCRTSNKSHTSLIYSGRVAAPHYTDTGGGSNYLCLPDRALYTNPGNITEGQSAHLYPVKYGKVMNIFNKFPAKLLKTFSPELRKKMTATMDFKDVPCAVCRVDGATTVLMIPAHNVCPRPGWDRQYHGYLMSQKYDYGKSEFVCVDVEAYGIPNTRSTNGDAFLHLTEFKCRSPSCKGYQRRKALSCTVCTR